MFKSLRFLVIALSLLGVLRVSARVVNSEEDRIRILGWEDHLKSLSALDRQRLSDKDEIQKERLRWEESQKKSLAEYREQKKKQKASLDETSPDYFEDLKQREAEARAREKLRQDFLAEREKVRKQSRSVVNLTEEEELGIHIDPIRVAWEKRDVLSEKMKGSARPSSGAGRPSFSPPQDQGNDFIPPEFDSPPPPPPMSPPPEFFEPDIPPPPPPPMPEGGFDVPPPPPGIDDGAPPPIFDDEF